MKVEKITGPLIWLIPIAGVAMEPLVELPVPPDRFQLIEEDEDEQTRAMEDQYQIDDSNFYGYWERRQRRFRYLRFWEKPLSIPSIGRWERPRISTSYLAPLPEPGEVLPIFGCLYRVAAGPRGKHDRPSMTFSKLKAGDIPEQFQVQRGGTYIVPLQKSGYGETWSRFHADQGSVRFKCYSIEAASDDPGKYVAKVEARISTRIEEDKPFLQSKTMHFLLRQGETYSLDTRHRRQKYHKFSVRQIVPRDEEWNTMGWVELNLVWRDIGY
jgi:hypothetical protein